ncbi:MAG: hypothetical protein RIR33_479 [Pseudomonadota bacterium]|jgi:3-oxoadipate enol-lactonase
MTLSLTQGHTAGGLAYWTSGRRHRSWLAVTHGSFGRHEDFCAVLAPFGERHNLLFWDLPGHGGSAHVRPARRLKKAAEMLAEVMAAAEVRQAHQLGFSFGGMIAQSFARQFPQHTTSLIAYACVPIAMMHLPSPWVLNALLKLQMAVTPWSRFCHRFACQVSVREDVQEAFARSMKQHAPHVRNAIYEALAFGCRNEPGFWFEMPVAQIKGSLDDRFPGAKSAMDALSGRLPPGFVEEVAGAGHLVHVEKPEAFQDSLGRLLHRLDGA